MKTGVLQFCLLACVFMCLCLTSRFSTASGAIDKGTVYMLITSSCCGVRID